MSSLIILLISLVLDVSTLSNCVLVDKLEEAGLELALGKDDTDPLLIEQLNLASALTESNSSLCPNSSVKTLHEIAQSDQTQNPATSMSVFRFKKLVTSSINTMSGGKKFESTIYSMKNFLIKKVIRKKSSDYWNCVQLIFEQVQDTKFGESQDRQGTRSYGYSDLNPFHFKPERDFACRKVKISASDVTSILSSFINLVQSEIDTRIASLQLRERKYETFKQLVNFSLSCFIDYNMNIYIQKDPVMPSLRQIMLTCENSLFLNNPVARYEFYLKLIYEVYVLHRNGYNHCQLSLDSVVFKSNRVDLSLEATGTMTTGDCESGVDPFIHLKEEFTHSTDSAKENESVKLNKLGKSHDVFSVGMIMLSLELGLQKMTKIEEYISSLVEISNIEEVLDSELIFYKHVQSALNIQHSPSTKDVTLDDSQSQRKSKVLSILNTQLTSLILSMLRFEPMDRISISQGLLWMSQLYSAIQRLHKDKSYLPVQMTLKDNGRIHKLPSIKSIEFFDSPQLLNTVYHLLNKSSFIQKDKEVI